MQCKYIAQVYRLETKQNMVQHDKQPVDRFSSFCISYAPDQHTDVQTDKQQTCSSLYFVPTSLVTMSRSRRHLDISPFSAQFMSYRRRDGKAFHARTRISACHTAYFSAAFNIC